MVLFMKKFRKLQYQIAIVGKFLVTECCEMF